MTTPRRATAKPTVPTVKIEDTPEFQAALAKAVAEAMAKSGRVAGHRAWATKEITPACLRYVEWIAREFPDLYPATADVDARLVMIASKAYRAFQQSDLGAVVTKSSRKTA